MSNNIVYRNTTTNEDNKSKWIYQNIYSKTTTNKEDEYIFQTFGIKITPNYRICSFCGFEEISNDNEYKLFNDVFICHKCDLKVCKKCIYIHHLTHI